MSTVIDFPHRPHCDRHQCWARFERADRFEHYLALQAPLNFSRFVAP